MCLYGKAFLKCCFICLNSVCCLLNAGFLSPSNQTANRKQKTSLPRLEVFGFLCLTDDVLDFVAVADKEIKMVRSINIPDRAIIEVKKAFNSPNEIITTEMELIVDLLYSELSSSINYFQMQTGYMLNKVLFSASTDLQKEFAEKLVEKSYVPVEIPEFYKQYSEEAFDASEFAGCISLAKVALEG